MKKEYIWISVSVFCIVSLISNIAVAQEGGIGGAVSNVTGTSPVDLSERVIKAIAEKRNQDALSLMTGEALEQFSQMLSGPEETLSRLVPTDWRILGYMAGESESEQQVLVQLKLEDKWPSFWLQWTRIDKEWKFSDSVSASVMEDIFKLAPSPDLTLGDAEVRSAVDSFFAATRAMDVHAIRTHIAGKALEDFEKNVNDEEFSENLARFGAELTYQMNSVRQPPMMPHLALVNYDVTVADTPRNNQQMLLLFSGKSWTIVSLEYQADQFEDNIIEYAGSSTVRISQDSFAVDSDERAVFEAFTNIMKAFVALDIQTMLNSTTGDAREEFIDLIGEDDDEMSEYREYAASYRWQVIDIVIDVSEPSLARVFVKQKYDDYDWEDSVILMEKVGGVWKMAEFE